MEWHSCKCRDGYWNIKHAEMFCTLRERRENSLLMNKTQKSTLDSKLKNFKLDLKILESLNIASIILVVIAVFSIRHYINCFLLRNKIMLLFLFDCLFPRNEKSISGKQAIKSICEILLNCLGNGFIFARNLIWSRFLHFIFYFDNVH